MSRKLNIKVVLALAAMAGAALGVTSAGAGAATYTWTPASAGRYTWNTKTNWRPNSAFPNGTTDAVDLSGGLAGHQTISLGQAITISSLVLGTTAVGGDGTNIYTIGGGGHALTVRSITENPGSAGDTIAAPINGATLNVTNSSAGALDLTGKGSQVGTFFSSGGTVNVSGGTLGASNYVMVKNGGTFGVTGGSVTTPGVTGLLVAYSGEGTLNVSSGTLTPGANFSHIYLASQRGSTIAALNVSGGVIGNSSDLTKTYTLFMSGDGGAANTTANVDISSGKVYLNQIVMQPVDGSATRGVSNFTQTGGMVEVCSSNYNYIGGGTFANGATNPGTATMSVSGGTLSVGGIKLQAGGILHVAGTGAVKESQAMQLDTEGIVNLSGGTLTTPEIAGTSGGFTGTFKFTGGTLAMCSSSLSYAPITTANSAGTFTNSGGTLAVGGIGTTGKTLIGGNYKQTAGTLAIDIGGTSQGTKTNGYDVLDTTTADAGSAAGAGLVSLGGDLSVRLVGGFTPTAADQFIFLLSNGVSGAFANVAVGSRIKITGGSGSIELLKSGKNNLELGNFSSATSSRAGSAGPVGRSRRRAAVDAPWPRRLGRGPVRDEPRRAGDIKAWVIGA